MSIVLSVNASGPGVAARFTCSVITQISSTQAGGHGSPAAVTSYRVSEPDPGAVTRSPYEVTDNKHFSYDRPAFSCLSNVRHRFS